MDKEARKQLVRRINQDFNDDRPALELTYVGDSSKTFSIDQYNERVEKYRAQRQAVE